MPLTVSAELPELAIVIARLDVEPSSTFPNARSPDTPMIRVGASAATEAKAAAPVLSGMAIGVAEQTWSAPLNRTVKWAIEPAVPVTLSMHRAVTAFAAPHGADERSTASCQSLRVSTSNEPVPRGAFRGSGELLHTVAPFTENDRLRKSLRRPCAIWTVA